MRIVVQCINHVKVVSKIDFVRLNHSLHGLVDEVIHVIDGYWPRNHKQNPWKLLLVHFISHVKLQDYKNLLFPFSCSREMIILSYKKTFLKFRRSIYAPFYFLVFWHLNGINRWLVIYFKAPRAWKLFHCITPLNNQVNHMVELILE